MCVCVCVGVCVWVCVGVCVCERERECVIERDEIRKSFFYILSNLFLYKEIIFQQKYVLDSKKERETVRHRMRKQF